MGTALTSMLIYSNSYIMRLGLGQRQIRLGAHMCSGGEEHLCSLARILGVLSSSKGLSGLMVTTSVPLWVSLFPTHIWLSDYSTLKESEPLKSYKGIKATILPSGAPSYQGLVPT